MGQSVFAYVARIKGWPDPPTIDTEVLMYVLGGMLGLGTLRTVEKAKGWRRRCRALPCGHGGVELFAIALPVAWQKPVQTGAIARIAPRMCRYRSASSRSPATSARRRSISSAA